MAIQAADFAARQLGASARTAVVQQTASGVGAPDPAPAPEAPIGG
jgi:hypothetical protein